MNFIRDNILKIGVMLLIAIIVIVVFVSCSHRTVITSSNATYSDMESILQNAAIKYVQRHSTILPRTVDSPKRISMSTLVNANYMKEMSARENSNTKCTGYVDVVKKYDDKNEYRYTPYIKCGKYYETKSIADYIKANDAIVTTGDGLYKINASYVYKGEYPKNNIKIGERLYKILEITDEGNLKLISTELYDGDYSWDDRYNSSTQEYSGINDFSKSRLKESLVMVYNEVETDYKYAFFSLDDKEYITEHEFCVGKRSEGDKSLSSENECKVTEKLYVGLLSLSDYYKVSIDSGCKSIGDLECNNYNFLYSIDSKRYSSYVTLTASSDDSYHYFFINKGDLKINETSDGEAIYPVFYINSNTLYKSGTGTVEDPYLIR